MEFELACQEFGIVGLSDVDWSQTSSKVRENFEGLCMSQHDHEGLLWKLESGQESSRDDFLASQLVLMAHRHLPRSFIDFFALVIYRDGQKLSLYNM